MNTKTPIIAGAIAAALSFCGAGAFAQDSTTTTTTTTTWSVPTYSMPSVPLSTYMLLNKKMNFDYTDLAQAKAEGYSDKQVATMAKIADKSGQPFSQIRILVDAGYSFPSIAEMFNGNLYDVYHVTDYEDMIRDYKTAYENTGYNSVKTMVAGSQETYDNTTTQSTTTTVTPAPSPMSNNTLNTPATTTPPNSTTDTTTHSMTTTPNGTTDSTTNSTTTTAPATAAPMTTVPTTAAPATTTPPATP